MRRLLPALVAIFVMGCGGRSDLIGASPGSSDVDATACVALAVTGDDTPLPHAVGFEARRPALVALDAADPPAAIVLGLDPLELTSPPRSDVGVAGVDPWGAWPPALEVPVSMATTGFQEAFAIAPATDGVFLIAVDEPQDGEKPGGVAYATDATAAGAASFTLDSTTVGPPAFIVHTEIHPVLGYVDSPPAEPGHLIVEGILDVSVVACGAPPIPAAAVFAGEIVIVAASTVSGFDCGPPTGALVATRIEIITMDAVDPVTTTSLLMDEIAADGPILALALVPRSDGAWLVYQAGGQDETTGPVLGSRLDLQGFVRDHEPIELAPAGRGAFAAAPFGDGLALVTLEEGASAPLEARLVDASGALVAGPVSIEAALGATPTAPLSILTAPSSRAWLVAWSGLPNVGADVAAQIHLARVGCAGP